MPRAPLKQWCTARIGIILAGAHGWSGPKSQQVFTVPRTSLGHCRAAGAGTAAFRPCRRRRRTLGAIPRDTSEEQGLLGARYCARHPLFPLRDTVATLNMDGINPLRRTRDVEISGLASPTWTIARRVRPGQGRVWRSRRASGRGSFFRADQFELPRVVSVPGPPHLGSGLDFVSSRLTTVKRAQQIHR
jgi:hypothetical protein